MSARHSTRPRSGPRARRPSPSRCAGLWTLLVVLLATTAGHAEVEVPAGVAATRGYFEWAAIAGVAWIPPADRLPAGFDFPLRAEGLFSTKDNLTNLVLGLMPTMRWHIPGFEGNNFGPYLATGPGLHLQTAWSSLNEFGGAEVQNEATLKWHLFLGASLARGRRTDLIVETRYTAPSELTFDYLLVAFRFHSER
jgi:hypothetical protein